MVFKVVAASAMLGVAHILLFPLTAKWGVEFTLWLFRGTDYSTVAFIFMAVLGLVFIAGAFTLLFAKSNKGE